MTTFDTIAQMLGVLASLIAAIGAAFASFNSIRNSRSLKAVHRKVDALAPVSVAPRFVPAYSAGANRDDSLRF